MIQLHTEIGCAIWQLLKLYKVTDIWGNSGSISYATYCFITSLELKCSDPLRAQSKLHRHKSTVFT